MDVNLCYGITPMEHRERYREAFALVMKAWQAPRDLRVERQVHPARQREPVARVPSSSRIRRCGCPAREHQHLRLRRGQRGLLLLPELLRGASRPRA
jgi:hypothetical protein